MRYSIIAVEQGSYGELSLVVFRQVLFGQVGFRKGTPVALLRFATEQGDEGKSGRGGSS